MKAYKIETVLQEDRTLIINNLPFKAGEPIEVIVLSKSKYRESTTPYSLRGAEITYLNPTEPVAQEDWSLLP